MKKTIFILSLWGVVTQASSLTLEEFLQKAEDKNKIFQSLEKAKASSAYKREKGDLELAAQLTAKVGMRDDKAITQSPSLFGTRTQSTEYSLGFDKRFSTGTAASVSYALSSIDIEFPSPTAPVSRYMGSWNFAVSQSLWKNSFGQSVDLRRQRESYVEKLEIQSIEVQRRQSLVEVESLFWDVLYAQQELSVRQESLARAKKIESWVQRRLENGIGDKSDLLQAQALVQQRELQLAIAQDEMIAVEKKVRDQLELSTDEKIPSFVGNVNDRREFQKMVAKLSEQGSIVRMDSYLSFLEMRTKKLVQQEVEEGLKPDLLLEGSYKTSGTDTSYSSAASRATDQDHAVLAAAVKFVWLWDDGSKSAAQKTAVTDYESSKLKAERKLLEGKTAWAELVRRHEEMSRKVKLAVKLSQIQTEKVKTESDKLSKGRTITSQVITAEQDASEAELNAIKLKVEQRKMESQARLFVQSEEAL